MRPGPSSAAERLVLFIAQGFGLGRVPIAPGTFGSLAGLPWTWMLLSPECGWLYLAGIAAGFFAAVWIGARAERILGAKDPGCIVIDEIAAFPLAYLPPALLFSGSANSHFQQNWVELLAAFALFRFFDSVKPLGIRQSQTIGGGWGLVIDDYLAAACTAVLVWLLYFWRH
jgi:phosphatidylglycerophosphatase A